MPEQEREEGWVTNDQERKAPTTMSSQAPHRTSQTIGCFHHCSDTLTHSFSSPSWNSNSVFGLTGDSRLSPSLTLPPSIMSPADPYLRPASAFYPASCVCILPCILESLSASCVLRPVSSCSLRPVSLCSPRDVLTAFLFGLMHL